MKQEYKVVSFTDAQALEQKLNELGNEGYYLCYCFQAPDKSTTVILSRQAQA